MSERLQSIASGRAEPVAKGLGGWVGGRCRRREYWLWIVPLLVILLVLSAMQFVGSALVAGVPILLVWIRRLHDMGYSGWFAPLINVAVNVAGFVAMTAMAPGPAAIVAMFAYVAPMVALGVWPGQPLANAYGPPPGRKAPDLQETFS